MKGKAEFNQQQKIFSQKIIFFKSEPKKKEIQSDLKIKGFFYF